MSENLFPTLLSVVKEKLNVKQNGRAGAPLGMNPVQVSQASKKVKVRESWWHTRFSKFWDTAYKWGLDEGQSRVNNSLLDAVRNAYSVSTQQELAQLFNVSQPTIGNWLSGKTCPSAKQISRMLSHRAKLRVNIIAEYHPLEPHKRGKTWTLSEEKAESLDWQKHLKSRKGVYLFYDSVGLVTYIGQSQRCLFTEISQRLGAELRGTRYHWDMKKSTSSKNRLVQGQIAKMISVYEILDKDAIHNIEVILIRGLMNNHLNNRLENFDE